MKSRFCTSSWSHHPAKVMRQKKHVERCFVGWNCMGPVFIVAVTLLLRFFAAFSVPIIIFLSSIYRYSFRFEKYSTPSIPIYNNIRCHLQLFVHAIRKSHATVVVSSPLSFRLKPFTLPPFFLVLSVKNCIAQFEYIKWNAICNRLTFHVILCTNNNNTIESNLNVHLGPVPANTAIYVYVTNLKLESTCGTTRPHYSNAIELNIVAIGNSALAVIACTCRLSVCLYHIKLQQQAKQFRKKQQI